MTTAPRKPMTFKVATGQDFATPAALARAEANVIERQQVGARVTKATYRQLKARAALAGVTVQALVEQAIDELLAKSAT